MIIKMKVTFGAFKHLFKNSDECYKFTSEGLGCIWDYLEDLECEEIKERFDNTFTIAKYFIEVDEDTINDYKNFELVQWFDDDKAIILLSF